MGKEKKRKREEKEQGKDVGTCPDCSQKYKYRQQTPREAEATMREVEKLRKQYEESNPPEWARR